MATESLDERCQRLQQEWFDAQFARMSKGYKGAVSVVQAVGAVGPLCYTTVEVAGQEVEAMVDTQLSATILFQRGSQPTLTQKWSVNPTETSHCSLSQTDVGPRKSD